MYSYTCLSCIYLLFLSSQTVFDSSHDYRDLSGVTTASDGFMFEHHDFHSHDSDEISQLCVPQDRLEDLNFFPDFNDDLIPFRLLFTDDTEQQYFNEIEFEKSPKKDFRLKPRDAEIMEPFSSQDSSSSHDDEGELPFSPPDNYSTEHEINDDIRSIRNALCVDLNKKPRSKRRNLSDSLQTESRNNYTKSRRCSHCEAENTPQWRMGPEGPKTLCNACGVRYKSGRLVPEYRPAASPTFDSMKHSNFHRKIMQKKITYVSEEKLS
ncbi:UNVERIFIED_CONTAM: GATA transcription factor 12 [Sesamum calycinum]|uniref:GATA transcription factor 12 n=1 Tax=Sesamum calycinum TaxID=2727403 RepID=A0AAW2MNN8_9LAMI